MFAGIRDAVTADDHGEISPMDQVKLGWETWELG